MSAAEENPELADFPESLMPTWEPLGVLGAGGMGKVFRCRHRSEGFLAAVKVTLLPGDSGLAKRTIREAETLRDLRHPGVVRVYAGGTTESGEAYLAMELLEGHTLDHGFPANPRGFMLQVARALHAIHATGIAHRDIKPANLLMTPEGRAVVIDFGLAFDPGRTRLTATGKLAGTPTYMAPELLRGEPPNPATDWYAWGVTLYRLVEGRLPYSWDQIRVFALSREVFPAPRFERLPPDDPLRPLLEGTLWTDPGVRITTLEVIEAALGPEGRAPVLPPRVAPQTMEGMSLSAPTGASQGVDSGLESGLAPSPSRTDSVTPRPRPWWALFLVVLVLAALVPGKSPPAKVPPSSAPVAEATPSGQGTVLDAALATRLRMAELRSLVQEVTSRHGSLDRLFSVSGHTYEIPRVTRDHVHQVLDSESDRFVADWEGVSSALRAWLVQLQDWAADNAPGEDPLARPEIRPFLQEQVLPLIFHLVRDFVVGWGWMSDPRRAVPVPQLAGKLSSSLREVLNVKTTLLLMLEDWHDLPRDLLPLQMILPQDMVYPGYPVHPYLERIQEHLRHPRGAPEYWLDANALLHGLSLAPWNKGTPWATRMRALKDFEATLLSPENPLRKRDQALLQGRLLVEVGRLARGGDQPQDLSQVGEWYRDCARRFRAHPEATPAMQFAVLSCAVRMGSAPDGVYYELRFLEDLLAPWHRDEVVAPFDELRQRFLAAGLLAAEEPALPFELSRWGTPEEESYR